MLFRHVFRNLTIAAMLFCASGCLLSTSNTVQESGVEVRNSTLRQIELGKTTESWLIATLGEPTSCTAVRGPGDMKILGYNHTVVKSSQSQVFLLFAGKDKKIEKADTFFEVIDGVITRYWRES